MAVPAHLGAIFKVDEQKGVPPHYTIILCEPRLDGSFLVASLTDRHNERGIIDIWPYDYPLCPEYALTKPSVIAIAYVGVKDQAWLNTYDAPYIGIATPATLERARCNLHWNIRKLKPAEARFFRWYGDEWTKPCGSCPQNV